MEWCGITLRVSVAVTLCCLHLVSVLAITEVRMEEYCSKKIRLFWKRMYQGRLVLSTHGFDRAYNSKCDTYIETWYGSKIMFYFESLTLNCDYGYLQFYDGTKASGTSTLIPGIPEKLCGISTYTLLGVFTTETRHLRVKYVTRLGASISNAMKILFTSYKDGTCPSYDYKCANGRCIDKDVACNGFNSCGDNSSCRPAKDSEDIMEATPSAVEASSGTAIMIGVVGGVGSLVLCVIFIRCAKSKPAQPRPTQRPSTNQQPGTTEQPTCQPVQGMHPQTSMAPNQPLIQLGQYPMQAQYGVMFQGPTPYGAPVQSVAQYGAPSQGTTQYGVTPTAPQYGAPSPGMTPYQTPDPASPPPAYNTLFSEEKTTKQEQSMASAPPAD